MPFPELFGLHFQPISSCFISRARRTAKLTKSNKRNDQFWAEAQELQKRIAFYSLSKRFINRREKAKQKTSTLLI